MTPTVRPTSDTLLAHGLGGSEYLPVPLTAVLIGGAWALTISFAVIAFAWRTPRYGRSDAGRELPSWVTATVDNSWVRGLIAGAALVLTLWLVLAAFGPDTDENPLPGAFYVLLWVGMTVLSALIGPVWRLLSPIRTVLRVAGAALGPRAVGRKVYPRRLGWWPAAFGLFAFVWLELASPEPGSVSAVRLWLLCYLVITLAGGIVCGLRWTDNADPFAVYSTVASRLAPFAKNADGKVIVRSPMNSLTTLPVLPGTVTVLAILLGSTAFDSFSAIPLWQEFVDERSDGSQVSATLLSTAGLLVFFGVVAVTFWSAARAVGGVGPDRRRRLPGLMAHSLIPIVIGYILAHYLQSLVEQGQEALLALGDPLGLGWNLLWLSDAHPVYIMSDHPTVTVTLKVLFVVGGHMMGVAAAHDASLRLLPRRHQLTGQLTMMVTMVCYTFLGLYLLFGG
ncbi:MULTISPECIES: hypothetical protein [Gordonia]|uniref:Membrane protein n=1 Tax=Gordonia alkanivorans CGMCC 6845 TaxID=1423140 RepID=W9DLT8_9ACTN|nr:MULTISPECIES: hypothetical protein [Gordonia]ETA08280.1 membrane protein [Gordonia alkanivorans CGMCC 6845]MDH3011444.1 hypothetical protein [Gordonia alkanivorans]MDH3015878.1 hypothetical protein [Gordonia alkanivorans]MDH3026904.1 hypothetical protein [Gordonia alkanivorans]MDH3040618.1 hypothetical protein [Gordonia alkanivorans]